MGKYIYNITVDLGGRWNKRETQQPTKNKQAQKRRGWRRGTTVRKWQQGMPMRRVCAWRETEEDERIIDDRSIFLAMAHIIMAKYRDNGLKNSGRAGTNID